VVLISAEAYELLKDERVSFKEYLLFGELLEGFDLERDSSPMRETSL
jgi:hypothetical protein